MVFEHAVEPEHGDVAAKGLLDALDLRQPVGDAAGTEHLERLDDNNLASEISQSRTVGGIEPACDCQLRSSGVRRLHSQRRKPTLLTSRGRIPAPPRLRQSGRC